MLKDLSIHLVGNKSLDQDLVLSQQSILLDEEMNSLLDFYFLKPFQQSEYYRFDHHSDVALNEVFQYVSNIFDNPENLHEQSVSLAKHLYECSTHPNIKAGEFYVVYFSDCVLEDEVTDAIGLFKTENKDTFLQVKEQNLAFAITSQEGIHINKLDKGCLIYNSNKENGYLLSIVDNTNKGNDAQFWKDDFLNIIQVQNIYTHTQEMMQMAKKFVVDQLPQEYEISKADQIDLLNKSVDYFKQRETFDKVEFEQEVFAPAGVVQSFREYDQQYTEKHELEIEDQFVLSPQAVKKQARIFKSVLKLDKNFHIYIHGKRDWIEKGVDEDGRKFYKIFYENEA